jgi:DNA-directed RNA polymerase subunit H (RpoH/RPB5)
MDDPTTVSMIHMSRIHLLDILKESGYNVDNYTNYSINHVATLIRNNQLNLLLSKQDPQDTQRIYIKYFMDGSRITTQAVHKIKDEIFADESELKFKKSDTLLIIMKDEPNDNIKETLNELWNIYGIFITIINIHRLQFNILKHQSVPPHKILNDEEISEFKTKYSIQSNSEIPTISRYDAVASIICMRPNQICKIIRKSRTSLESEYYRICI